MKLTREQIENILEHYKGQPASKFAEALEVQDVRALCDAALQVEAAEKSVEYWREQTSNANKQAEAMENDMMFARCQVEAMREAIRRAVERLPSLEHHAIDCGHHIRRAACDCGADERNLLFDSLRLDLSQSLNPKNEEGKS
jgi:hypothetical protein